MSPQSMSRGKRATHQTGLLSCAALALALHGLVLARVWMAPPSDQVAVTSKQRHAPGTMRVTTMKAHSSAATTQALSAELKQREALRQALASASPRLKISDEPAGNLPTDMHQGQVLIDYPDAPLPDGRLRMRVFAQVDAAGHVESLRSDADPEIGAPFLDAVRRGLNARPLTPPQSGRRAALSKLCLEVVFDEKSPGVKADFLSGRSESRARCLSSAYTALAAKPAATPSAL